jgi:hypothetical protein
VNLRPKPERDYFAEQRALFRELQSLESLAGIQRYADRAREGFLVPMISHAPAHSDRFEQENEENEKIEQDHIRHNIRSLYFGVANIELRKNLIKKEREIASLLISGALDELSKARIALNRIRHANPTEWCLWVSIIGVACVAVGYLAFEAAGAVLHVQEFGVAGAVAGAFAGYILARYAELDTAYQRSQQLISAEGDFDSRKREADEASNEGETFTYEEEWSGMPSPESWEGQQLQAVRKRLIALICNRARDLSPHLSANA